jgi:hypothetical protein
MNGAKSDSDSEYEESLVKLRGHMGTRGSSTHPETTADMALTKTQGAGDKMRVSVDADDKLRVKFERICGGKSNDRGEPVLSVEVLCAYLREKGHRAEDIETMLVEAGLETR